MPRGRLHSLNLEKLDFGVVPNGRIDVAAMKWVSVRDLRATEEGEWLTGGR